MDRTTKPAPDGALAIALELVAEAVEIGAATGPVGLDFHGAWAAVRQAALASVTPAAAPARPADLGREARAVLERYTAATRDLEPSVDSAVGIGVAAIGALVGLAALGVGALARIGDALNAIEPQVADAASELRAMAGSIESANQTGWGG